MPDPLSQIPLSAIRVFEAAARLSSFTRAGQELGITQAAVSWQVKALEQRLGLPLFRRLTREVVLTPEGERLARAASEAMAALRVALQDLGGEADSVLTITALPSLAIQWLAPRLGGFQIAHPDIAVRLDTSVSVADLRQGEFDLALRGGKGQWPDLEVTPLFRHVQTPLCSPQTRDRLGGLRDPGDLLKAERIGAAEEWAVWFAAAGLQAPPARTPPGFNADAQTLEVAAALSRDGVALGSPIFFAAEIAQGRLVQPFEIIADYGTGYFLVIPPDRVRRRKIAAFRDWIVAQAAADPVAARHQRPS